MILPPDRPLLDLQGRALVVPVNRVGVMGAGVARVVKLRWPEVFPHYRRVLDFNGLQIGSVSTFSTPDGVLMLVATKLHYRDDSRLEWVDAALAGLAKALMTEAAPGALGVHLPALGCGCGGLAWHDVKKLIDLRLAAIPAKVYRYAPGAR